MLKKTTEKQDYLIQRPNLLNKNPVYIDIVDFKKKENKDEQILSYNFGFVASTNLQFSD